MSDNDSDKMDFDVDDLILVSETSSPELEMRSPNLSEAPPAAPSRHPRIMAPSPPEIPSSSNVDSTSRSRAPSRGGKGSGSSKGVLSGDSPFNGDRGRSRSRSPRRSGKRCGYAKRGSKKLLVSNLHPDTQWMELKEIFSKYGEVSYVSINVFKNGYPTGEATIEYRSREHARNCLKNMTHGVNKHGRDFIVQGLSANKWPLERETKDARATLTRDKSESPIPMSSSESSPEKKSVNQFHWCKWSAEFGEWERPSGARVAKPGKHKMRPGELPKGLVSIGMGLGGNGAPLHDATSVLSPIRNDYGANPAVGLPVIAPSMELSMGSMGGQMGGSMGAMSGSMGSSYGGPQVVPASSNGGFNAQSYDQSSAFGGGGGGSASSGAPLSRINLGSPGNPGHAVFSSRIVHLRNLPRDYSEKNVQDLMKKYGRIQKIELAGIGSATVSYVRVSDAVRACTTLNNTLLGDKFIALEFAQDY